MAGIDDHVRAHENPSHLRPGVPEVESWFDELVLPDARLSDVLTALGVHPYREVVALDGTFQDSFTGPGELDLLGGPLDETISAMERWERAVHPADLANYIYHFSPEYLRSTPGFALEYRLQRADGSVRWVVDSVRTSQAEDGRTVVDGIVYDVTDQRALSEELELARSQVGLAVSALEAHLYSVEVPPDGQGPVVNVFSSGPLDDEWLGPAPGPGLRTFETWRACVHPDDLKAFDQYVEQVRTDQPQRELTYRLVNAATGKVTWVWERNRRREYRGGRYLVDGVVTDVSERIADEERLATMQRRMEAVLESIDELLFEIELMPDGSMNVLFASPGSERLLGGPTPPGSDAIETLAQLVHDEDRELVDRVMERLQQGERAAAEYRIVGLDGITRWIRVTATPRPGPSGGVLVAGLLADVSDWKRLVEDLGRARDEADRRARIDALTGLYNRRHFSEALEAELARAGRADDGSGVGILLLDIDHFKTVNDRHGHRAGDEVLVDLSARVRGALRSYDTVARWGGEEFAVLLPDLTGEEELRRVARGISRAVSGRPFSAAGTAHALTVSIGGALVEPGTTVDGAVDAADRALYGAKRRGRARTCLFGELTVDDLVAEEPEAVRIAQALALSVSVREGMPATHSEHVAQLTGQVAEHLGLPPALVTRCRLGGWMHDVGKLAIPDRVLTKPGPLDEAEWETMRTHPEIGEAIVRRVTGLADAAAAVRNHHERWDGTGYPDGLRGEEIPLEARIVAVVDAYSAITAERSYKAARSHEEALAELRRSGGTHLDPVVVEALCAVARPFEERDAA